jgi:hypothetical protein
LASCRRLNVESLEDRRLLAVMTVTSLADNTLAALAGDAQLSLREAVEAINTGAAIDGIGPTSGVFGMADEIQFAPALFGGGAQTIALSQVAGAQQLNLLRSVTITGPGAGLVTIDGGDGADGIFNTGDGFRIFNIDDGAGSDSPVTITGLRLTGGDVTGNGGAINSVESLTVTDSIVTGNASTSSGGGLYLVGGNLAIVKATVSRNSAAVGSGGGVLATNPLGSAQISASTLANNTAGTDGGGVDLSFSLLGISDSTISGNFAAINGGGLVLDTLTTTTVSNSTISGNTSGLDGGGVYVTTAAAGTTEVAHSTITENIAGVNVAASGGGLYGTGAGVLRINHSIIAGNAVDSGAAADMDITTSPPGTLERSFILIGDNDGTGLTEAPVGAPDATGQPHRRPGRSWRDQSASCAARGQWRFDKDARACRGESRR